MNRLESAVENMAYMLLGIDTGDVWQRFSCSEIESIAAVLSEAGHKDAAAFILAEHGEHDEPGDEHYREVPEWEIVASLSTGEPQRCGGITFPSQELAHQKLGVWRRLHPHLAKAWSVRPVVREGVFQ